MKNQTSTNLIIRSSLALTLTMAIWSPIKALSAKPADENMMNHTDGGNMMNHTYGWMDGWMDVGLDCSRHLGGSPASCRYHQAVQGIIVVHSRPASEVNFNHRRRKVLR